MWQVVGRCGRCGRFSRCGRLTSCDGRTGEDAVGGVRDDVVDVDVVVELVDLYAMRPGVELGLGTNEGSDGEGAVGLKSFVEGVDEFGALLYFLSCAGGEVRVGIAVDAEADTDVGVAFLRFCGK